MQVLHQDDDRIVAAGSDQQEKWHFDIILNAILKGGLVRYTDERNKLLKLILAIESIQLEWRRTSGRKLWRRRQPSVPFGRVYCR